MSLHEGEPHGGRNANYGAKAILADVHFLIPLAVLFLGVALLVVLH